ncbi:MAG: hypothetical protein MN733_22445 [Nitrososphaera sp.]|nr:hypothetical protein [Nitrososphaera sp.]
MAKTMCAPNRLIFPRQLYSNEIRLLEFLLTSPFSGRDELQRQVVSAKVSGECSCGCPSIILSTEQSPADRAFVRGRIPIEAEGYDSDGVKIHFLLHVVEGYLSELEIFREDSRPILNLPDPDSLKLYLYE